MTLKPREKIIAIGVGAVLGLFVLDAVLLEPMFLRLASADDSITRDTEVLNDANNKRHNGALASARWKQMSDGRIPADASTAQSKLLNHVDQVARNSNVNFSSVRNEHGEKAMGFSRTGLRVTGNMTMSTLVTFLQRLQTPDMPVRVTDLQIKANKEGNDDLAVDIGISTIYKLSAAEEAK